MLKVIASISLSPVQVANVNSTYTTAVSFGQGAQQTRNSVACVQSQRLLDVQELVKVRTQQPAWIDGIEVELVHYCGHATCFLVMHKLLIQAGWLHDKRNSLCLHHGYRNCMFVEACVQDGEVMSRGHSTIVRTGCSWQYMSSAVSAVEQQSR